MANNDMAWDIYRALVNKGAHIGTASVSIIEQVIDDAETKRWIPVTERMPEPLTEVLVFADSADPYQHVAYYADGEWYRIGGNRIVYPVTHWQPKPLPPKERRDDR